VDRQSFLLPLSFFLLLFSNSFLQFRFLVHVCLFSRLALLSNWLVTTMKHSPLMTQRQEHLIHYIRSIVVTLIDFTLSVLADGGGTCVTVNDFPNEFLSRGKHNYHMPATDNHLTFTSIQTPLLILPACGLQLLEIPTFLQNCAISLQSGSIYNVLLRSSCQSK
jgi:hypothetical protein